AGFEGGHAGFDGAAAGVVVGGEGGGVAGDGGDLLQVLLQGGEGVGCGFDLGFSGGEQGGVREGAPGAEPGGGLDGAAALQGAVQPHQGLGRHLGQVGRGFGGFVLRIGPDVFDVAAAPALT